MIWIISILICCTLYGWLEYVVHRFDMHSRGSYRFQSHTIEHHGQAHMGTEQASLTLKNSLQLFVYTIPITALFTYSIGWVYLICWTVTCIWASFAWTSVHRNIHDEPGYWYAYLLCPWLYFVRRNHLKHHDNPKRNYGGMFFFLTDPFMRTL